MIIKFLLELIVYIVTWGLVFVIGDRLFILIDVQKNSWFYYIWYFSLGVAAGVVSRNITKGIK